MPNFIVIAGAPGSGKTTVSERLHQQFNAVLIDFGALRVFHLDPAWTKANAQEEQMAFENLVYILQNYARHGYQPVLVNDLRDHRVQQMPTVLQEYDLRIITLIVTEDAVLADRVLNPQRDSGFRDVAAALAWNRAVIERPTVQNETKLDNTNLSPQETVAQILALLEQ